MEVHHHTHSARRKWTNYFWEFLMLFLAVFCGFLAENQREHYIEHNREKQFIGSLINDLKLDTVGLESRISRKKTKLLTIDSVLYPLTKLQTDKLPFGICHALHMARIDLFFFPNDGTIQQLKGSGGLRLIRNREAVDSIEAYHYQMKRLIMRQESTVAYNIEFSKIMYNFINGKEYFENRFDSSYAIKAFDRDKLVKIHPLNLNELINALILMRDGDSYDIRMCSDAKKRAVNMIDYLRNEYHLK